MLYLFFTFVLMLLGLIGFSIIGFVLLALAKKLLLFILIGTFVLIAYRISKG